MNENTNIEDWYRKEISGMDENPSDLVWEKLQDSLDTDNVWIRLKNSLNRWDKLIWWWKFSYRTFIFSLILISGYYLIIPGKNNKDSFSERTQLVSHFHDKELIKHNAIIVENSIPEKKFDSETGMTSATNNIHGTLSSTLKKEKPDLPHYESKNLISNHGTIVIKDDYIEKVKGIDAVPFSAFSDTILKSVTFVPDIDSVFIQRKINNGFGISSLFSIKNQWLLCPETFSGFGNSGFSYTKPDFGFSLGVSVGKFVNNKWCTEWGIIYSQSGQKYVDYLEGQTIEKEINLGYFQINALGKRKWQKQSWKKNIVYDNLIVGVHSGYLLSSEIRINNMKDVQPGMFSKLNVGIVLGYEREYVLGKQWLLAPSIRYYQGLNNIYTGTTEIPKTFNSTFTASIEAGISLRYVLEK